MKKVLLALVAVALAATAVQAEQLKLHLPGGCFVQERLTLLHVPHGGVDFVALLRQPQGSKKPEAAGASGDENVFRWVIAFLQLSSPGLFLQFSDSPRDFRFDLLV